jgi:uncharacterized membrane protein
MDWAQVFELAISGFEIAGIAVLVFGSVIAGVTYVRAWFIERSLPHNERLSYTALRQNLGRAILLGLELLVTADIIKSITIQASLQSVATLGLLVVIRTFLSWSLEVEIEGQWPWKRAGSRGAA